MLSSCAQWICYKVVCGYANLVTQLIAHKHNRVVRNCSSQTARNAHSSLIHRSSAPVTTFHTYVPRGTFKHPGDGDGIHSKDLVPHALHTYLHVLWH